MTTPQANLKVVGTGQPIPHGADTIDQGVLVDRLMDVGVPEAVARSAAACVIHAEGVLLYGSWARGQAREFSDLDLLILNGSSFAPAGSTPKMSVAHYTTEQLAEANRTLFGMHLARDGLILHDSTGVLNELLSAILAPQPDELLHRIHRLTAVLDVPEDDRRTHLEGLCKVARYLLRSAIYASALKSGRPSFSLDDLSEVMSDPSLPLVLSSHKGVHPAASEAVLTDLIERLSVLIGPLPRNPFGSLDALIVAQWYEDRDLAAMATLAIANDDELPYEEVQKVIL